MKKITLICSLLVSSVFVNAQSYLGFLTDNYSGVNSVILNPANIVDSRFKTDINLAGASFYAGNDYYGVNVIDALKPDYDFDTKANKTSLVNNRGVVNIDVMGPSFMFNITPTSSIALFTRARSFVNVNDVSGNNIDIIDNNPSKFYVDEGNVDVFAQAWAELGLSYARVLKDDGIHFFKGGISLKYLQGGGSGYAYGRDLTLDYDEFKGTTTPATADTRGQLVFGVYDENAIRENFDYELPKANGFGVDLGFVYEWRPNYKDYVKTNAKGDTEVLKDVNKYKLKLGLSITDIGAINYKNGQQDIYNVNRDDIQEGIDFNEADDFDVILDDIYNLRQSSVGYKTKLPTALHLNADWNLKSKIYLNVNADLALTKRGKERTSSIANMISVTPRFETKWFSFYLPLNAVHSSFTAGAGLRAGPLYVGSGSIISVLANNNSKSADVYAGLKIPVYQSRLKDKDEDGIVDKLDACPEEAGPEENNGCPWGDADEDTILDNVDACPEEAGPVENNGCPWGDADKDTVLDNVDACIEIAGPVENNGCPWLDTDGDTVLDKDDSCINEAGPIENKGCPWLDTDGDTVLDKDDACITVPGPVENKGCPEVTVEVQKTLNEYAKTILFNSGKASIKEESTSVLNEIVKILNEYPDANFSIEGHTDSVGSTSSNQLLSESRASSVMKFLIENGIASKRLAAKGFGESKPIASNATSSGRALNRRVEINLVK